MVKSKKPLVKSEVERCALVYCTRPPLNPLLVAARHGAELKPRACWPARAFGRKRRQPRRHDRDGLHRQPVATTIVSIVVVSTTSWTVTVGDWRASHARGAERLAQAGRQVGGNDLGDFRRHRAEARQGDREAQNVGLGRVGSQRKVVSSAATVNFARVFMALTPLCNSTLF